jgi:glycosyltransferase involved in cell wall biosynthesis
MQMLLGALGRWPLPILNYTDAAMDRAVSRALAAAKYDLVHADSIHMIRYARRAHRDSGAKVVYNWHNIESEAMSRFAATVASAPKRWYATQTAAKLEHLEREILPEALGHIVCSAREREQLLGWSPGARIHVAENGVDTAYFSGAGRAAAGLQLVFVGSMDYFPNIDAAVSFTRDIWPQLRARIPGLTLAIVGAKPTPEVQALAAIEGVTVTGTVPDVRPYYADALAAVVPLRTGGGTRLKILEAMAAGTPVISTELGAEGLAVTPNEDILMAPVGDAEAWARQIEALSGNLDRRKNIVAKARHLVESRYDWNTIGADLAATYERWLRGGN